LARLSFWSNGGVLNRLALFDAVDRADQPLERRLIGLRRVKNSWRAERIEIA